MVQTVFCQNRTNLFPAGCHKRRVNWSLFAFVRFSLVEFLVFVVYVVCLVCQYYNQVIA